MCVCVFTFCFWPVWLNKLATQSRLIAYLKCRLCYKTGAHFAHTGAEQSGIEGERGVGGDRIGASWGAWLPAWVLCLWQCLLNMRVTLPAIKFKLHSLSTHCNTAEAAAEAACNDDGGNGNGGGGTR